MPSCGLKNRLWEMGGWHHSTINKNEKEEEMQNRLIEKTSGKKNKMKQITER